MCSSLYLPGPSNFKQVRSNESKCVKEIVGFDMLKRKKEWMLFRWKIN